MSRPLAPRCPRAAPPKSCMGQPCARNGVNMEEALAREMDKAGRRLPCFIEVNTGEEPQKAGILPEAADAFIRDCRDRLRLPIAGLMCIPPEHEEPALHFALLREIARRNGLDQLSMGMSADFETAIR